MVLDVIEIKAELLCGVLDRRGIGVPHLRPAGDAGLDAVPHAVERDALREICDKARSLWTRPDEAHLAPEHIPQLRQLVDPRAANETAHRGHATVVRGCPLRLAVALGVDRHAAELEQR